jgi:hypothetical protein
MYARIENNEVTEWPILSMRSALPQTSFPPEIEQRHLPDGYVLVKQSTPPACNPQTQKLVEVKPVTAAGEWLRHWDVVDLSAEELAQRQMFAGAQVRGERDAALKETDWTQVADAPVDKDAWATYRQALRDVTAQPGFPWTIEWPVAP